MIQVGDFVRVDYFGKYEVIAKVVDIHQLTSDGNFIKVLVLMSKFEAMVGKYHIYPPNVLIKL